MFKINSDQLLTGVSAFVDALTEIVPAEKLAQLATPGLGKIVIDAVDKYASAELSEEQKGQIKVLRVEIGKAEKTRNTAESKARATWMSAVQKAGKGTDPIAMQAQITTANDALAAALAAALESYTTETALHQAALDRLSNVKVVAFTDSVQESTKGKSISASKGTGTPRVELTGKWKAQPRASDGTGYYDSATTELRFIMNGSNEPKLIAKFTGISSPTSLQRAVQHIGGWLARGDEVAAVVERAQKYLNGKVSDWPSANCGGDHKTSQLSKFPWESEK